MRRTVALAVALSVAVIGWGATLYAQDSKAGGSWTIVSTEEPDTLDPQKTGAAVTAAIFNFLGQPLLAHGFDNRVVPGLADSWTISTDGMVWTFKLKPGAVFQDGTPVTAQAVKASIERAVAPETKSPVAKAQLGPVKSVDAVDTRTLRLTLSEPFAPLLNNLTDSRLRRSASGPPTRRAPGSAARRSATGRTR